jgi:hypothetical protein
MATNIKVENIAVAIDQYFDNDRRWSSPRVIQYANKLQYFSEQEWENLSLFSFTNAGLLIKLAIFALEETKYRNQNGPKVNINYLPAIFSLNENFRDTLYSNQKNSLISNISDSATNISRTLKPPF